MEHEQILKLLDALMDMPSEVVVPILQILGKATQPGAGVRWLHSSQANELTKKHQFIFMHHDCKKLVPLSKQMVDIVRAMQFKVETPAAS